VAAAVPLLIAFDMAGFFNRQLRFDIPRAALYFSVGVAALVSGDSILLGLIAFVIAVFYCIRIAKSKPRSSA
jgi:hypothetical protein